MAESTTSVSQRESELESECEVSSDYQNNVDEREVKKKEPKEDNDTESSMETPIPLVLEPDHPMMERFQIALKNHLLRQIDKLSNQVYELDNEVKKKEKEKEETGLELYTLQREIFKQQKNLEDCEATIQNLMKERQSLDESVKSKKVNWKEEINRLNCEKKKENDKKAEYQKLTFIEKQMEKWKKEMQSELTVTQRISEKSQYDKKKLLEEKRKMDMYLLRLMTTVSNYESEIRLLEGEIDLKHEEKDLLNQTLADAAADLQALVAEQKRLFAAWNSVVSIMNQRNLTYLNVSKELKQCQEGFRSLNAEIESYKRSAAEEMKKNEKLSIVLGHLENDFESSETCLKNLMNKKSILEDKITSTATMICRTEAEYQHTKMDTEKIQINLTALQNSFARLNQEKRNIEDEAMDLLQEQMSSDKSASHLNKCIREIREKIRKQEFGILEGENKISQKFLEVERLKETISQNNEIITEMNNDFKYLEEELRAYEDEITKSHSAVIQKQGNYANLVRKIEKHMEKTGYGKPGQSPLQLQIIELEKTNAEIQAKNDKLQSFWLLQQSNNVKLTQQRNEQLKDISLLRRQVSLMEQKALKIDTEFEKEKKIENQVNKSITQYQYKLTTLNETLVGKKDYRENLGKENSLVQAQFIQNLKDSELEQIQLKAEIKEVEGNLEELAETFLATQREMLAWEKKIQAAVETKNTMQKERSSTGEVGQMKAEIHRMEVRYGQLKRAQEKLISDLEQCVLRREVILDGFDALEKRQNRGFNTRYTFQKKLETMRNNIRSLRNENKKMEKLIKNSDEVHKELKKAIAEKEAYLTEMGETTRKMNQQLDNGKLQKNQNLEMLIRRQKKCKMYEIVKNKKHRLLFKNEETLENELQKIKNINTNLISVMEALIEDFPMYEFQLRKIYNSFRAKPA